MKHAGPAEQGLGMAGGADDASAGFPAPPPAPSETAAAVIKALAVDDDDFMRDLLHRVLAADGMQVENYGSAADLLVAGHLASATVLRLDVKMPGMSGLELRDPLRRRGIDLPVVFVSGCADLAMAVTAMRNGAADFIERPFQP